MLPLLVVASCDTRRKVSNEKKEPLDTARRNSVSLTGAMLDLMGAAFTTAKILSDSIRAEDTPAKPFSLVKCNEEVAEFRDSTKAASRYKIKIKVKMTEPGDAGDSLSSKPKIRLISIMVNKKEILVPELYLKEFDNLVPCSFRAYRSVNKRNLLIYPGGFYSEKFENVIRINLPKCRIGKINGTTFVYSR